MQVGKTSQPNAHIQAMFTILTIVILIFSVILHEVSHGLMAERLGDPTARIQGRLTLNPAKHIDPVGSILIPIITAISTAGQFTFGWAKPVVYNPYNLKNRRTGEVLIALAGPASNVVIALVFGIMIRLIVPTVDTVTPILQVFAYIVIINITLAVFNLIPLPPLDGSKLFLALLPNQYGRARLTLERIGPIFVIVVLFFLWQIVAPVVPALFSVLTGVHM